MRNITTSLSDQADSNAPPRPSPFPDLIPSGKAAKPTMEREYLNFAAGTGALNYGQSNPFIQKEIMAYLMKNGIGHGRDLYTVAKDEFLHTFHTSILQAKSLDYQVMICGPTGSSAVEDALGISRKIKKRDGIFAFTGGFHGLSQGSLAVTAHRERRQAAGGQPANVTFMPYPTDFPWDTIAYMEQMLGDVYSGVDKPAAVIVETIQTEGGIHLAPAEWLWRLRELCDRHDILLICDDSYVGCGRTGAFFSFEEAAIVPDMVVLSHSIGGYGQPMSLLLVKSELDVSQAVQPGAIYRAHHLAFAGAIAALKYRDELELDTEVKAKGQFVSRYLTEWIAPLHPCIQVRGKGLIWGIDLSRFGEDAGPLAQSITARCNELGLVIVCVGRKYTVIKLMPRLTIGFDQLEKGCDILRTAIMECIGEQSC
ncbi:aminotransferase class III-fold pyridoxal phosphate-dependent enzyme [Brevibacillus dissolubilis]|uniref:aminotransferase class III-fold pyridoxal phosphate-dependent enzyme n=1 Tax=Brevibacillus dissolubilis TaxID=1844116 RepID=UPI001116BD60|nr:aminotransferase class III-fold pyridoxal phosphate-dependent enzyme [Brevibacillus dissolubilis]